MNQRNTQLLYALNALLGAITGAIIMITILSYLPSTQAARTEPLFIYGTLTNPIVRFITCRCIAPTTDLTIENYKKVERTIVPEDGTGVTGELVYLTPAELSRLDFYEGVPHNYRRIKLDTLNFSMWTYMKR